MKLEVFDAELQAAIEQSFFAMSSQVERVADAEAQFRQLMTRYQQRDCWTFFNDWLTFCYRDDQGRAIDLVACPADIVQAIERAELGFYSIRRSGNYITAQNVVSQTSYHLAAEDGLSEDHLLFGRIFTYRGQDLLAGGCHQLPDAHRQAIVEHCQRQYSRQTAGVYYSMADYMRANPLLLYSTFSEIDQLTHDSLTDYTCYEVIAAIEDLPQLQDFLNCETCPHPADQAVRQWFDCGQLRAEVMLDGRAIYFECNQLADAEWVVNRLGDSQIGLGKFETRLTHLCDLIDSAPAEL